MTIKRPLVGDNLDHFRRTP